MSLSTHLNKVVVGLRYRLLTLISWHWMFYVHIFKTSSCPCPHIIHLFGSLFCVQNSSILFIYLVKVIFSVFQSIQCRTRFVCAGLKVARKQKTKTFVCTPSSELSCSCRGKIRQIKINKQTKINISDYV